MNTNTITLTAYHQIIDELMLTVTAFPLPHPSMVERIIKNHKRVLQFPLVFTEEFVREVIHDLTEAVREILDRATYFHLVREMEIFYILVTTQNPPPNEQEIRAMIAVHYPDLAQKDVEQFLKKIKHSLREYAQIASLQKNPTASLS